MRELALRCCFLLLPDWICAGVFVFSSMFESKVSIIMAWTRVCLCACVFVCKRQVGIGGIKRVRISVQRRGGTRKREREREREKNCVCMPDMARSSEDYVHLSRCIQTAHHQSPDQHLVISLPFALSLRRVTSSMEARYATWHEPRAVAEVLRLAIKA